MSILGKLQSRINNNQGMVSLLTIMVLMVVISLIVIGFAQFSRRNQRTTMDRQLSTQAFYAAETGVNDTRKLFKDKIAAGNGVNIPDKSDCQGDGPGNYYSSLNYDIDAAKGIKYSCLLVDAAPKQLSYSNVSTPSTTAPLISDSGNFTTISFEVQAKNNTTPMNNCQTQLNLTPVSGWNCGYGVLRFDLMPTDGTLSFDTMKNNTMTVFGMALNAGTPAVTARSTIPFTPGPTNPYKLSRLDCNNTKCYVTVTGLTASSYYLRVSSIYKPVSIKITGTTVGGAAAKFRGAQAIIDSTGKSNDVLRRIQVSVPIQSASQNELADYAIQTTDSICKQFAVMNGFSVNSANASVTGAPTNSICAGW